MHTARVPGLAASCPCRLQRAARLSPSACHFPAFPLAPAGDLSRRNHALPARGPGRLGCRGIPYARTGKRKKRRVGLRLRRRFCRSCPGNSSRISGQRAFHGSSGLWDPSACLFPDRDTFQALARGALSRGAEHAGMFVPLGPCRRRQDQHSVIADVVPGTVRRLADPPDFPLHELAHFPGWLSISFRMAGKPARTRRS